MEERLEIVSYFTGDVEGDARAAGEADCVVPKCYPMPARRDVWNVVLRSAELGMKSVCGL